MEKKAVYLVILILVTAGLVFWSIPLTLFAPKKAPTILPTTAPDINNKLTNVTMEQKILMVVAFKNFRDEEYFIPKEILEKAGFFIDTTSNQKGMARGTEGGKAVVHVGLEEVESENYQAIIFCGGPGMAEELDNPDFHNLAEDFYQSGKPVAAICVAPALLAKAGILKDKKATVWSSALDKSLIKILENNGAIYEENPVVVDKTIITANGPSAAKEFAKAIVNQLSF